MVRRALDRKTFRFLAVSAVSVVVSQMALIAAFGGMGWSAQPSNFLSFVVGGIVNYQLNRSWVWKMNDASGKPREVGLFVIVSLVGLAASTWAVGVAEVTAAHLSIARGLETAMVATASLAAFGVVAIGKFAVMNRWVFVVRSEA